MRRQGSLRDRSQGFLKFSTLQNEERWWRAKIDAEDLRWIQQNLGHGLDGQKRFRPIPQGVALSGALYPDCPWSDRIAFIEGEGAPRVLIGLGHPYNYRLAFSEARERRDPLLSPHGLFRNLEPNYHKHAFQFMQQFGPLFIDSHRRHAGDSWWASLSDFWDRQARFVAVAKLWENRFDSDKLRDHWVSMGEQHERLDLAGAAPLGYIPDPTYKYISIDPKLPWQWQSHEREILQSDDSLQRLVYDLLHRELILHTQDCVSTWTRKVLPRDEASDDVMFEPTRSFTSLWGAIWELFGLDTRQYGWKLCELCGRLFYPKDRRSVCCSTEHQSLWSKRVWARKHRADTRHKNRHRNYGKTKKR